MPDFPKYAAGTGGFLTAPFDLLSTEMNALGNGSTALSSVGGASGVFDQSHTGGYVWGVLSFVSGGAWTPGVGGYMHVFFLTRADNAGFGKFLANAAQARRPDAVIAFLNTSHAAGEVVESEGLVQIPAIPCRVLVRSVAGASMPATGNKLKLGAVGLAV